MFKIQPHFWYSKSQRNGVFVLLLLIVCAQILIGLVTFDTLEDPKLHDDELLDLQARMALLREKKIAKSQRVISPFNPNYISDAKGQELGMSLEEIDRLLDFRSKDKFVNSVKEFQQITKVSDSLLKRIAPYFQFPAWVLKKAATKQKEPFRTQSAIVSKDLNLATAKDLQAIRGIGPVLSERIVKYRGRLQGFSLKDQLNEVWKLEPELVAKVWEYFEIKSLPKIQKINVNTATFKEVLANPYIDYELCKKIFNYRSEVAELQSIEELKNIDGFPIEKYGRIVIYLEAK